MNDNMIVLEQEASRQIKRGALLSYFGITVNILAILLYTPWMIQRIGQENYGLYTLAISIINIFLLDFGLSTAVSRYISKYNVVGDQQSVNNILGLIAKIFLLIDLVIFLVLIVVYFNIDAIYRELSSAELDRFRVVYIIVASYSILSFPFLPLNGILIAYEKFSQLKLCDVVQKISSILLIVFALMNGYGLYTLVTINALTGLIIIFLKIIIISKKVPLKVHSAYKNKHLTKEILIFSIWNGIVSLAQRFIFAITPSILGAVSGSGHIAVFGIAAAIEGFIYTISTAINGLFLAKVSRIVFIDDGNSKSRLEDLMIRVGRIQLFIIGLFIAGFALIGRNFILLWVGEKYVEAYYAAILLMLPTLIYLPQQIANTTIIATNKVKHQAFVYINMAIMNIVLSIFFSRAWGVLGAAISIFIAYSMRNLGMNMVYYKILGIDVFSFFKKCHGKISGPFLLALVLGYGIVSLFPRITWPNLFVTAVLIGLEYLIVAWLLGFNRYEKSLIRDTIHGIILRVKRVD